MKIDKEKKCAVYNGEFLTFYHYKEPLKEIEKGKGVGFYGTLLSTQDGEKVQCHYCGKLFSELNIHVRQSHNVTVTEYKDEFKLAHSTSLVSEVGRQRRKLSFMKMIASLSPEERDEWSKRAKDRYRSWKETQLSEKKQPKHSLETKNKRGTCPDQILEKIKEVYKRLRHVPTLKEFMEETGGQRYKHLIFATFGSWNKALKTIGMSPSRIRGKGGGKYTDEYLLEALRLSAQENGCVPTDSDSRRGFIPSSSVYKRHFGSLHEARVLAGVYELVDDEYSIEAFGEGKRVRQPLRRLKAYKY